MSFKKLLKIKQNFTLITTCSNNLKLISQSRHHQQHCNYYYYYYSKIQQLKRSFQQQHHHLTLPRSKLSITRVLGVSGICGSLFFFWPSILHAMDGSRRRVMLLEGHSSTFDFSEVEEKHALWVFVRRFKLPVFFFFTVLTYWDHPALLAIKIILFLLTTKPSPFSVYVLVEQVCRQYMLGEPHLYRLKSLYANKVEVQDYKLICLARVEIRGQKFRFVGMLGGWWILPLSSVLFPTLRNNVSNNLLIKESNIIVNKNKVLSYVKLSRP